MTGVQSGNKCCLVVGVARFGPEIFRSGEQTSRMLSGGKVVKFFMIFAGVGE